jgi:hypothetical protein
MPQRARFKSSLDSTLKLGEEAEKGTSSPPEYSDVVIVGVSSFLSSSASLRLARINIIDNVLLL